MKLELDVNSPQNSLASNYSVSNSFNTDVNEVKNMLRSGITFAKEGNRAEARQLLLRVTEFEPANETAWLWLASISEYPEELLVFLQNVLNINPTNERAIEWSKATKSLLSKTLVQRGINASHENQKEFAKQCFLQAIVHDADNEMAWLWLASASDSTEEKMSHLQKVLNINPENETALTSLKAVKNQVAQPLLKKANSAAIAGERESARELLSEVLHQMPELEEAWILKAYLMDDFYSKIDCYEKVLTFNPDNEAAQAGLASLKALIQKTAELKSEPLYQTSVLTNETKAVSEVNPVDFANEQVVENVQEPVVETKEELLETAPEYAAEFNEPQTPEFEEPQLDEFNEPQSAKFDEIPAAEFSDPVAEFNETPAPEFEEEVLETAPEPVADYSKEAVESIELLSQLDEDEMSLEFSSENPDDDILMTDSLIENNEIDFAQNDEDENYLIDDTAVPNADLGLSIPKSFANNYQMDLRQDAPNEQLFSQEIEQEILQEKEKENPVENADEYFSASERFLAEDQTEFQKFDIPAQKYENNSFELAAEPNVENLATESTGSHSEMEYLSGVPAQNETFVEPIQPESFQFSNESEDLSKELPSSNESENQFIEYQSYSTIRESDVIKQDFFTASDYPTVTNIDASFYQEVLEQTKAPETAAEEFSYTETYFDNAPVAEQPQVEENTFAEQSAVEEDYLSSTKSFDFQDNLIKKIEEAKESSELHFEDTMPVQQPEVVIFNCPFCNSENEQHSIICHSCRAMLSLSDLEMMLAHHEANQDIILQAIERLEIEKDLRGFNAEELKNLGIAHLNAKNLRKGYSYLNEASQLDPNDVVLGSKVNFLAIRLSEIEEQENKDKEHPVVSKTILIVDDSPTVRKLISGKLEKCGHSVISAIDGMDALAKINEVIPDLVLLDITMPRLDGYQVCKLIRNNEITKDVPIVMISGKDGFFDKVRGRMAGSTGYITKPFGPDTLMKTIETYIN